jgi:hypothetical protein
MSNNINGEDQLDGADEVKEVKRRGKTKLINVWNIPRGHRVVVNCNELNQPIGEEAGVLAKFLGMVARNGSLCSLSFKDWRLLIGKKDRNHKQINKEAILNQVKVNFHIFQLPCSNSTLSQFFSNCYAEEISLPCPHGNMGAANNWREMEATQVQFEIHLF